MKAIILAGGLGTRLRESVPDLPKAMAPIAGRPFLAYLLDQLHRAGFPEVILSVGYRAEAIKSHFGDHYHGMVLDYVEEPAPLGTGGGVAYALKGKTPGVCLVMNGDTYLDIDFGKLIQWYDRDPALAAMVLKRVQDVSRYGAIKVLNGTVHEFIEKGLSGEGLINAGTYILNSEIFEKFVLPEKFSLESDLLQNHLQDLHPRACETDAWFIDIGVPDDYQKAQNLLPAIAGSYK